MHGNHQSSGMIRQQADAFYIPNLVTVYLHNIGSKEAIHAVVNCINCLLTCKNILSFKVVQSPVGEDDGCKNNDTDSNFLGNLHKNFCGLICHECTKEII